MKKNDYQLIVVVAAAAALLFLVFAKVWNGSASMAEVSVNGKKIGRYRLSEDQEIEIRGKNLLVIRDGKADMTEADCPDKLCVRQKPISKQGESIVCLPNKVIVTVIHNATGNELDAVVK